MVSCDAGPCPGQRTRDPNSYELRQERASCNNANLAFDAARDCKVLPPSQGNLVVYSPPRLRAADGQFYSFSMPYSHAAWQALQQNSQTAAYREGVKHDLSDDWRMLGYAQADEICGMLGHQWGAAWWTVHVQNEQEQRGYVFKACSDESKSGVRWQFCISKAYFKRVLGSLACRPPPRVGENCAPSKSKADHTRCYMKGEVLHVRHTVKHSKFRPHHQH